MMSHYFGVLAILGLLLLGLLVYQQHSDRRERRQFQAEMLGAFDALRLQVQASASVILAQQVRELRGQLDVLNTLLDVEGIQEIRERLAGHDRALAEHQTTLVDHTQVIGQHAELLDDLRGRVGALEGVEG